MSQIADATDRLSYVVEMTEKAANRTMDLVEQSAPLVNQLGDDSRSCTRSGNASCAGKSTLTASASLAKRIEQFLVRSGENAGQLSSQLNDILLAQDYQDLTGQVIKRVTKLVTEVEQPREAGLDGGQVDRYAGIEHDHVSMRHQAALERSAKGEGRRSPRKNERMWCPGRMTWTICCPAWVSDPPGSRLRHRCR